MQPRERILAAIGAAILMQGLRAEDPAISAWLTAIAASQLSARATAISQIANVTQAEQRKAAVRSRILDLVGGLPAYSGPLNAFVSGRTDMGSYAVENVQFESLPQFPVTANLYLPGTPGRHPAILMQIGHWDEGKTFEENFSAVFATKGFVVLAFDPIGQGERMQGYNPVTKSTIVAPSVPQHVQAGGQTLLLGQNLARYMIWDAKRALDYLVSRPEVDSARIGATGCSGGGVLTMYIATFDDRIQAAAPACSTQSNRADDVGDSEQSLIDYRASGLDCPDFAELFAPKPWLIGATTDDFLPLAGVQAAYAEISKWYAIYNASDRVSLFVGPGPHGTPVELRQAIYAWMSKWLNGGIGDPTEPQLALPSAAQLQVTPGGQVNGLQLYQVLHSIPFTPGTRDAMLGTLRSWINHTPSAPAIQVTTQSVTNGVLAEDFTFTTEPGLLLTARLLSPQTGGRKPAKIVIQTTSLDSPAASTAAQAGNVVLVLMPRGLPSNVDPNDLSGDFTGNMRAMLVGRNLPSMRAYDILQGVEILNSRSDVDPAQITASATGIPGIWLLLAAAVDSRLSAISLDRTPLSLRSALLVPAQNDLHDGLLPGFAQYWDLLDVASAVAPRSVTWTNPTDWLANVVPPPPCSYTLSGATTYSSGGGAGNIVVGAWPACFWNATSNVPWIKIASTASGAGNGSVTVSVGSNATGMARIGALTIAGQAIAISQAGTGGPDFRGVGRSDAVLYDPRVGQEYTALSNGDGTYSYVGNLFTPAFDTLRSGDFKGSGKAGLVVYNSDTALAYIGFSNGDGTFVFTSLFWSPGYDVVETGDLNGDGRTDVALYNSSTGTLYTGISNGDGTFTYKYTLVSRGFTFVRLADFNGDGKADLLVYSKTTGAAYLGIGDGAGAFTFRALSVSPGYDLADIGDLNNDGKSDVILYNSTNGNAATGVSDGLGGFTFTSLLFSPGFTSIRLADYTGDGKADVTVYNKNNGAAYFGTGNGTGGFNFQSLFWSPGYDWVIPEDVNGDGKCDIILYNSGTGTEYTGIGNEVGDFKYTYSLWGANKTLAR